MFELVFYLLLAALFLYSCMAIIIIKAWFSKPFFNYSPNNERRFLSFSILIPFRNEIQSIPKLLESLSGLDYPHHAFEILLIDDHSDDNSFEYIERASLASIKLLKNKGEGKKAAIATGLDLAQGEYIIQSDADCSFHSLWLKTINAFLQEKPNIQLLAAPVTIKDDRPIFSQAQSLDFLSLQMVTAGLIEAQHPCMLNGANLIYKKESWLYLKDKQAFSGQESPSGDDSFLLYAIKKHWGAKSIAYLKSRQANVQTEAQKNLLDFLNQRLRWASKTKYIKDTDSLITGFIVAFINLLLLTTSFLACFNIRYLGLLAAAFLFKMLIDLVLLLPFAIFFKKGKIALLLPLFSVFNYFYVAGIIIFSSFVSFKWKNRKYQ